jgi:hypothetical protein
MSDVKKIFDPSELKAEATLAQTIAVAGKDAKNLVSNSSGMGGSLENVGMSQDLINKLQKDAAGSSATTTAAGQENKHGN